MKLRLDGGMLVVGVEIGGKSDGALQCRCRFLGQLANVPCACLCLRVDAHRSNVGIERCGAHGGREGDGDDDVRHHLILSILGADHHMYTSSAILGVCDVWFDVDGHLYVAADAIGEQLEGAVGRNEGNHALPLIAIDAHTAMQADIV